jgi:hypothetical protein
MLPNRLCRLEERASNGVPVEGHVNTGAGAAEQGMHRVKMTRPPPLGAVERPASRQNRPSVSRVGVACCRSRLSRSAPSLQRFRDAWSRLQAEFAQRARRSGHPEGARACGGGPAEDARPHAHTGPTDGMSERVSEGGRVSQVPTLPQRAEARERAAEGRQDTTPFRHALQQPGQRASPLTPSAG